MTRPASQAYRRRRALAHQCPDCRRHWALQLIEHPAGFVVRCRFCLTVHRVVPAATSQARNTAAISTAPS